MAIAWFVVQYVPYNDRPNTRRLAIDAFTRQIEADGGSWAEAEVLGNYALVKVSASTATINAIKAYGIFPATSYTGLDTLMSDLSNPEYKAIQDQLLLMGYTQAEINASLGSSLTLWRQKTFRQLLEFAATRKFNIRWNGTAIVFDGEQQVCINPDVIDKRVK